MGLELRTSFLKHTPIGKSTQAEPGTASANLRYISRNAATDYVEARHMPSHYWAAQDYLDDRESRIRKNGRVCDKFVLVYSPGTRMDHAVEATRAFLDTMGKGRAPYYFTLQNFTEKSENPHAHIIFIDEDPATGKRVFRTSDLNSTKRIKDVWENAANSILEREGYTFRLDREAVKEMVRAVEVEAAPPDAPAHQLEESPPHAHERQSADADHFVDLHEMIPADEDEAMNSATKVAEGMGTDEGPGRIVAGQKPVSTVAKVRGAYQLTKRVKELHSRREQLRQALHWRERYEHRSRIAATTADRITEAKQSFEADHTYGVIHGKPYLKGWKLPETKLLPKSVLGIQVRGFQSASRKEALEAQKALAMVQAEHNAAKDNVEDARRVYVSHVKHTANLQRPVDGYDQMNPDQQREALQDMEKAEVAIAATRSEALEGVTAESVWEAYKAGEIDAEEALAACQAQGFSECAETIRHDVSKTQEEEMGQE